MVDWYRPCNHYRPCHDRLLPLDMVGGRDCSIGPSARHWRTASGGSRIPGPCSGGGKIHHHGSRNVDDFLAIAWIADGEFGPAHEFDRPGSGLPNVDSRGGQRPDLTLYERA